MKRRYSCSYKAVRYAACPVESDLSRMNLVVIWCRIVPVLTQRELPDAITKGLSISCIGTVCNPTYMYIHKNRFQQYT